jgi:hypothetical protein
MTVPRTRLARYSRQYFLYKSALLPEVIVIL